MPVHPLPFVTVTVNVPAVETEIVCVVAPVDQLYPENTPASKTVEEPEQNANPPVIDGERLVLMVVVAEAEPKHPST